MPTFSSRQISLRSSRTTAPSIFVPYSKLDTLFLPQPIEQFCVSEPVSCSFRASRAERSLPLYFGQTELGEPIATTPFRVQTTARSFRRGLRNALFPLPLQLGVSNSFASAAFSGRPTSRSRLRRAVLEASSHAPVRSTFQYTPTRIGGTYEDPLALAVPSTSNAEIGHRFPRDWRNGFAAVSPRSPFDDLHNVLSFFFSSPVHFTAVNALSVVSFAFNRERRRAAKGDVVSTRKLGPSVKTSNLFLQQIETERASRFQRAAVRIPDLIRLSFVSVYLKKPQVLASLFATTLAHLPRNRKETQFLRFLRKLVKVFTAQRKERRGVRLRFQGRVNRWRRTKHRQTERGKLNLFTYTTRLEYGTAQAITRKGAIGVRL
jgi:hypothetical protein